ncbi:oxidoreductase [Leuconostoc litchii]|uniref:Diguanylate cyclase n=1 Tax=Leuconostoc litchii TaxID=1981069 RepID=A0A6P2CQ72_9LACO|nr:NAD(P)-binding domain-containing protein [Leuconostoc litchii]TYC47071.1 diguanylate cyclase [Leuconostoc litchii]GMA69008.1 oxidoreductase [Leuconostoc litchii]
MQVTIFGKGNMGQAIGQNFDKAGNDVNYITSSSKATHIGDLVVLAVPYSALENIAEEYKELFKGKVVVDITNPLNFKTWSELVVPADSSAAEELQEKLSDAIVLKAFNTNFAATLQTGRVGNQTTTVLVAGADEGKKLLTEALAGSSLNVLNAGPLKRARELEATGFLQMSLAASEQIGWTGGFAVIE